MTFINNQYAKVIENELYGHLFNIYYEASGLIKHTVSCLLVLRNMEIIAVVKDSQNQQPIPTVWRATFSDIVNSFVAGDYSLKSGISNVEPVQHEIAQQIQNYISEYGEVLISLQPDSWKSSVCMWYKDHWEVLIDLCTVAEGLSDLVLKAKVSEVSSGFQYQVEMVYVP